MWKPWEKKQPKDSPYDSLISLSKQLVEEIKGIREVIREIESDIRREQSEFESDKQMMQDLSEELSEVVSSHLDPSTGQPWTRSSPCLPGYVESLEAEVELLSTSAVACQSNLFETAEVIQTVIDRINLELDLPRESGEG